MDASSRRYIHDSCTKHPTFNVEGRNTAANCLLHVEVGKVDVRSERCSCGTCATSSNDNVEGSKTATSFKQYAVDGMVNVTRSTLCPSIAFASAA